MIVSMTPHCYPEIMFINLPPGSQYRKHVQKRFGIQTLTTTIEGIRSGSKANQPSSCANNTITTDFHQQKTTGPLKFPSSRDNLSFQRKNDHNTTRNTNSLALESIGFIQRMKRICFCGNNVDLPLLLSNLTMVNKLLTVYEEALDPYCHAIPNT